ncbi:Ras-related protein Rab-20-like isoform X1 [Oopsacas minuta]|uniref:Ras-related protein Rab-20-like isoform X1 n=1 Tax=Oopsacas minuta TaxID=111878 RepID=A0AAV7JV28_9METZ|nr:Ras-related protein Rab-20-like isoform X1 [Oopsacas minuta]
MASGGRTQADLKVIILGDHSVGKTSFIQRYLSGSFVTTQSTLGASLVMKKWSTYHVAIWDTAGEERFAAISNFYTRGAHAAILAYDVTNRESFDKLSSTFAKFLEDAHPDCLCVVVGMKSDLLTGSDPAVPTSDARDLAVNLNLNKANSNKTKSPSPAFFTTSAKTGENVENVFALIQTILISEFIPSSSRSQSDVPTSRSIRLDSTRTAPEKKSCC